MITRVEIEGFRTCEHTVFEPRTTVSGLFGRNGTGKTTVLTAIFRVCNAAWDSEAIVGYDPRRLPRRTLIDAKIGNDLVHYELEMGDETQPVRRESLGLGRGLDGRPLVDRRTGTIINRTTEESHSIASPRESLLTLAQTLFPNDIGCCQLADSLRQLFRSVRFHRAGMDWGLFEALDEIGTEAPKEWFSVSERQRSNAAPEAPAWHTVPEQLVEVYRNQREIYDEALALLGRNGLQLIKDISIQEARQASGKIDYFVNFHPSDPALSRLYPSGLAFARLPAGLRRVIEIVVGMVCEQDSVILWDHPEEGIHRDLLESTFDIMRTYADGGQLIVASQSEVVLNSLEPSELHMVSLVNGRTCVRSLPADDVRMAGQYIQKSGPFSEYLKVFEEV